MIAGEEVGARSTIELQPPISAVRNANQHPDRISIVSNQWDRKEDTMAVACKSNVVHAHATLAKGLPRAKQSRGAANDAYFESLARVPKEMREATRWLLWRWGRSHPTKEWGKWPYYVSGRARAKDGKLDTPEDLAQLVPFDAAWEAFLKGNYAGLGFALGPDAAGGCWQGIDLDDVAEQGLIGLQNELPGYVEISPSGKGAHAIGYGPSFATLAANATGVEAYAGRRYFTVTGHRVREPAGMLPDLSEFVRDRLQPLHVAKKLVHRDAEIQKHSNSGNTETQARGGRFHAPVAFVAAANDAVVPQFSDESLPDSCIPTAPGMRNRILFNLARHLKSHYPHCLAEALLPYVRAWHARFLDVFGTKEWMVTEEDFLNAHEHVRVLEGDGALDSVMDLVGSERVPAAAFQATKRDGRCWVLLQICYHVAQRSSDRTFFLSARYAAKLSEMSLTSASSVLRNFVRRGILEEVKKGQYFTRMASEYRWIGPDSIYACEDHATPIERPSRIERLA